MFHFFYFVNQIKKLTSLERPRNLIHSKQNIYCKYLSLQNTKREKTTFLEKKTENATSVKDYIKLQGYHEDIKINTDG